ncbi:protein crumbs homolog 2 isoform X1 [Hyperolius riggenbachi]|uniref:protein crumbs homolog 2 isoform X1 n=1 Tax=Hyperolius riggenbachi TaxID=752182 RepID=UPI0035A3CB35
MEFRRVNPSLQITVTGLLLCLCAHGFAQNCLPSSCLNGGTCEEKDSGYTCHCPTEPLAFAGPNCGDLYDACTEFECPKTHMCQAKPGYLEYQCLCQSAHNCTTNECDSDPCPFENSECSDEETAFTCKCQNEYSGPKCLLKKSLCAPNPCNNNAECVESTNNYTCVCQPGYAGQYCETLIDKCATRPCENEAICVDKGDRYRCFCVPGFQGHHCEIDINECASTPCQNNGSCLNLRDEYVCQCAPGYTGVNCEMEIDECQSNPCQNGATCRDHVSYFSCECAAGYKGATCALDIDECQSQPCMNGGLCVDAINRFYCNCSDTGYEGDMCEVDILECASNPCVNNATCVEGVKGYSCLCWEGYSGDQCELDIDECAERPCLNGALCLQRSNETFYMTEPEFTTEFRYNNAAGYVCRCQPGFAGENCSQNIDECESDPCKNGGICIDLINGYECHCALGYTGVLCAVNIDDCENNPCQNGATCLDGVADYVCTCPGPALSGITWGGKNCSVVLEGCSNHSCQNKALCIPTYEKEIHGFTCKCPPGFYGDSCSIPTTFSFTSNGYIIYDIKFTNKSKRSAEETTVYMAVRFRTTLPNMVLLYRGDEHNFLTLELFNGFLQIGFRNHNFSHLIIDEHRVDDGNWYKAEVILNSSLQLILHHEGCRSASCSRNQAFGDRYYPRVLESFTSVYIGGLGQDFLFNNTLSKQNFTGCMEDLIIDYKTLLPQNIKADTSFGMDLGCNKTDWCHPNPCHYESLCIDQWTSYKCHCVRPYTGPTCLQEYNTGTFFHEGAHSFANFTITQDIEGSFNVSAFIRTLKPDGLLLQIRNSSANFFTVYLKSGQIHISIMSMKNVSFDKYISHGKKQMIYISVTEGLVSMNGIGNMEDTGQLPPLSIEAGNTVLVGGIPPEGNVQQWGGYFKGCLQDVRVNDNLLEFFQVDHEDVATYPGYIHNVTKDCVSDDVCKSVPCKNNGTCVVTWNEFTCTCSANFTGPTCEEPVWCHRSPCPANSTCQDIPGGYTCIVNATFREQNPVVFISNISSDTQLTSVSLDFRTRDMNAVLFQASKDLDHISIMIRDGFLHVFIQIGNSVERLSFVGEILVSDALWHRVVIMMIDSTHAPHQWIIRMDNGNNMTLQGSAASLSFLAERTPIALAENYTGCLGQVSIGGLYLPFEDQVFPQQFIRKRWDSPELGCRGANVCGATPCLHGGKCYDAFNYFICECALGWGGLHCELNIDDCKLKPCIHGSCTDLVADYRCTCSPGYTGKKCETNVDDCQQHQCLNGGICLDGVTSYTCKCPPSYIGSYCQWPYPPEKCGINVTCLNGARCNSGIWGANCTCKPGFKGRRCEVNIDDCEPNPCFNGGTCQDSVNNFKCICNASFSGLRCEKSNTASAFPFQFVGVAVPVSCGVVLLFIIVAIFMALTARKRRQSEGTYSPSQQEVAGARLEMDNVLKVPPEERLI